MVKKMLVLGVALVMLFLFAGCNRYPIDKFNSLAELQAVFPKDVYYFDFNQEGIKEAGKFELTKTSNNKLEDGSYDYIRYSIWYDVEYTIDGQKQERKLRVVATDYMHSIASNSIYFADIEDYFYYFIVEGARQKLNEEEKKYFTSICEFAIEGKYKREYPINKFKSLKELQAAFPKDVYYFDFEQEGIKETGKFRATRTSNDGQYIIYSVEYVIDGYEYQIYGQKQKIKLKIIAVRNGYMNILEKIETSKIICTYFTAGYEYLFLIENAQKELLDYYIFIRENYISICKLAIEGKYQVS